MGVFKSMGRERGQNCGHQTADHQTAVLHVLCYPNDAWLLQTLWLRLHVMLSRRHTVALCSARKHLRSVRLASIFGSCSQHCRQIDVVLLYAWLMAHAETHECERRRRAPDLLVLMRSASPGAAAGQLSMKLAAAQRLPAVLPPGPHGRPHATRGKHLCWARTCHQTGFCMMYWTRVSCNKLQLPQVEIEIRLSIPGALEKLRQRENSVLNQGRATLCCDIFSVQVICLIADH